MATCSGYLDPERVSVYNAPLPLGHLGYGDVSHCRWFIHSCFCRIIWNVLAFTAQDALDNEHLYDPAVDAFPFMLGVIIAFLRVHTIR